MALTEILVVGEIVSEEVGVADGVIDADVVGDRVALVEAPALNDAVEDSLTLGLCE